MRTLKRIQDGEAMETEETKSDLVMQFAAALNEGNERAQSDSLVKLAALYGFKLVRDKRVQPRGPIGLAFGDVSAVDAGESTGIQVQRMRRLFAGRTEPTSTELVRIAQATKCDLITLIGDLAKWCADQPRAPRNKSTGVE